MHPLCTLYDSRYLVKLSGNLCQNKKLKSRNTSLKADDIEKVFEYAISDFYLTLSKIGLRLFRLLNYFMVMVLVIFGKC